MCGLVGFYGNPENTSRAAEAFRWLLYFDVLRGEDSTGIAIRKVNTDKNKTSITIAKAPGIPGNLYMKFPEIFTNKGELLDRKGEKVSFVIGHNRHGTIGGNSLSNAHPFHHGHIVGAHNGTITHGLHNLPNGEELLGQTDSEKMFYAMSKGTTLQEVVNKVHGAIAFSWWDIKTQSMNLFRNKERPLWVCENVLGNCVIWSSERWILELALTRSKNKTLFKELVELPADTHWEFSLDKKGALQKKTETVVKFYAAPVAAPKTNSILSHNAEAVKKVPHYLDKEDRGENGWLITSKLSDETIKEAIKFGCNLCKKGLSFEDKEEIFFLEKHTCFCSTCAAEFEIDEVV